MVRWVVGTKVGTLCDPNRVQAYFKNATLPYTSHGFPSSHMSDGNHVPIFISNYTPISYFTLSNTLLLSRRKRVKPSDYFFRKHYNRSVKWKLCAMWSCWQSTPLSPDQVVRNILTGGWLRLTRQYLRNKLLKRQTEWGLGVSTV